MEEPIDNPFSVTRAADFTDDQIHRYWVDLADGDGGFFELIKPRSAMPMLILGGKGSGKTHIMRYLSFPLQQLRHAHDLANGIRQEGYLGIYMRCSGLNSARFRAKGQAEEVWAAVFNYYMELWLAQMAINTCYEIVKDSEDLRNYELAITSDVRRLFDIPTNDFPNRLQGLSEYFRELLKELDIAINNCVIDRTLNITFRATLGNLIFGVPQVLSRYLSVLKECLFVYLIDEFENLTEPQQKFVNTLIREKQSPCSFKVGTRLYGVRTYSTYCADEDNKEGSEYAQLPLDRMLRQDEGRYFSFARRLVIKRLATRGVLANVPETDEEIQKILSTAFENAHTEGLAEQETKFVIDKYKGRERPYFRALRQTMEQGIRSKTAPGLSSRDEIDAVIQKLVCSEFPLLEKLNCFAFYQQWSSHRNLIEAAESIHQDCQQYMRNWDTESKYHDKLLHFKYDLLAQIRRECDQKQQYIGFDTLVSLSWGNPRHLLILLKHIFSWAAFKEEKFFGDKPISIMAQVEGVKEAAEWFFRDAQMTGQDGKLVQDAIRRLGTLYRSIRYSNKPSECSLSTFSYEPSSVSAKTRQLIDLAEKWSFLVDVGGQRDRNSERVDVKLQLNRMLAPLWDISFSRRGVLPLPGDEVNAIFDPAYTDQFEEQLKVRIARMMAPVFGMGLTKRDRPDKDQGILPGMVDD